MMGVQFQTAVSLSIPIRSGHFIMSIPQIAVGSGSAGQSSRPACSSVLVASLKLEQIVLVMISGLSLSTLVTSTLRGPFATGPSPSSVTMASAALSGTTQAAITTIFAGSVWRQDIANTTHAVRKTTIAL